MSKKLSVLTKITTLLEGALIYIVDLTRPAGDQSVGITKQDFANELGEATGETPSFSAIWTTGLTFFVTADVYYINDQIFSATAANVTLDTAHATLDRLDYLGAFANGTVGKVTGTPATSALVVAPDYDPSDFFPIKLALVKATDTTPSDPGTGDPASTTLIFDEDTGAPTEFNVSLTANLAVNTNDPKSGTKNIEGTNANQDDIMTFTWTSLLHTDDVDALSWWTKLKEDMGSLYISVSFFNGTKRVGSPTYFNTGSNGFNSSSLIYQKITINRDDFWKLKSAEYDSIQIRYYVAAFDGWFFDLFELHGGSPPLPPDGTTTTYANDIFTNTENFDGNLSDADDTVQQALETLDDLVIPGATSELIGFAFSDETTDLAVGTSAVSFQMPNFATTLTDVSVNVVTAPTGSVATFDINEGGVSVLSTKITIDAGEFTSEDAATPPVISDSSIAANAIMTVDIDGVGSTVAGAGGKVWIYFTRT